MTGDLEPVGTTDDDAYLAAMRQCRAAGLIPFVILIPVTPEYQATTSEEQLAEVLVDHARHAIRGALAARE